MIPGRRNGSSAGAGRTARSSRQTLRVPLRQDVVRLMTEPGGQARNLLYRHWKRPFSTIERYLRLLLDGQHRPLEPCFRTGRLSTLLRPTRIGSTLIGRPRPIDRRARCQSNQVTKSYRISALSMLISRTTKQGRSGLETLHGRTAASGLRSARTSKGYDGQGRCCQSLS